MVDKTMIILDRVEGGFSELPEPILGVGKQQLLPKLTNSLKHLPFLLCGPPGCGKKSLLQIAAKDVNLKVKGVYDLGHIAGGNKVRQDDLEKVISWYGGRLQKNIMGETCLLVLYGAEHLDKEGAAYVRKYDVVLIANERTESLKAHFGDRTLWANKLTEREMKQSLAILHPEARPSQVDVATRISNGDLRQAQIHITSGTTNVDKAKNVYFDVHDALCKGVNKELNWHGRKWASTNHLLLERSLEEHVTLSENLLTADFIEDPENEHAAPNCIGNLADVVAGMAVKKLVGRKRSDFKLTYPPSGQRQTLKRKYPECRDDMIKYFAPPERERPVAEALAPQPVRRPVFPKRSPPPNVQAEGTKPRPNDQAPPPNTDSSSSPTDSSAMEDATACLAPAPTPDTSAETSLPPTVPMEEIATETPQAEAHVLCTHPEYDLLGGWGLYKTRLREYHASPPCTAFPPCQDAPADLRNAHWLLVEYHADASLDSIVKKLEETLPTCLIDAVANAAANTVFIYKPSQQNIRSRLQAGMLEPNKIQVMKMCKGKGRGDYKRAHKDLITRFQQLPGKHISNMYMGKAAEVEEYSAKTLLEAFKDMTAEDFTNFVLDARIKNESEEELTGLERLMCNEKIESRVRELRRLSSKVVTNVIYASKVKETGQVQPQTAFKSSWKKIRVTIHDKSLLTPLMPQNGNTVTLETFVQFPELHQNVTLFLPGESRKGKTELAKYICLVICMKYQNENPRFLMTNTLDSLRANQALMLPGVPVLMDDIGGEDNDQQLIYSSVSMWKAILQVKDATQNRARNDDLMWAARQPRVMTTNCMNLEDWVQAMFPRVKPSHKAAIVLRVAEVETITDSLYSSTSAPTGSASFLPNVMSTQAALDAVANLFD